MPFNYYTNLDQINTTPGQSSAQIYLPNHLSIMDQQWGYMQNPAFGESDFDRVEMHVYDINKRLLFSQHNIEGWSTSTDAEGMPQVDLNINKDLLEVGFNQGAFVTVHNLHRDAVGKPLGPKFKIHGISRSRTEIRLVPSVPEDDDINEGSELEDFYSRLQRLKHTSGVQGPFQYAAIPNNPLWTSMQLNFGYNRIYTIGAWLIDDIFPPDPDVPHTLLLKLYQPLPSFVEDSHQCWLVAESTQPVINTVHLDTPTALRSSRLLGPNFDLCLDTTSRLQTDFRSYNQLTGEDSDVTQEIYNSYSSSLDGVKLNIDYSIFENYIHFGSAEQRINNFVYKLKLMSSYDRAAQKFDMGNFSASDIVIYEYTGSHGSSYVKKYQKKWVDKKVKLINQFDDFEKWLYFESGSQSKYITESGSRTSDDRDWSRSVITPFPKLSGSYKNDRWSDDYLNWNVDELFDWAVHSLFMPGPEYQLLHVTHSKANTWYNAAIASSSAFDKQNNNLLRKATPQFINDTGETDNETYLRFLDLVGQAHDVPWAYSKYFTLQNTRFHNTNYENKTGISDDTVFHIGKSYGINLVDGDPNQELWQYKLGKTENGFRHQNSPTASIQTMTARQRTTEVWKRLVNNLPLLLKAKGTRVGARALINCYGIPEHILPIYEYGSSKKTEQTTRYEEERFTYCLNFVSHSIATSWGPHKNTIGPVGAVRYNVGGSDVVTAITPNSVEFRCWPDPLTSAYSQSLWQVNNEMGIVLHRSHSTAPKENGQPENFTEYGHFSLVMSHSRIAASAPKAGSGYTTVSTGKAKIFEKDSSIQAGEGWWTILLNRKARSSYHSSSRFQYDLTAMRANYGTVDQTVSCSLRVTSSGTGKGQDNGYMSSSINNSWSGSLQHTKRAYLGGYVTRSVGKSYLGVQNHGAFGTSFHGAMQELRYYANPINNETHENHTLAPEMYASNVGIETVNELLLRVKLTEKKNHWSGSARLGSNSASIDIPSVHPNHANSANYWDANRSFIVSGTAINYPNTPVYNYSQERVYIDTPELGPNNYTSNKIRAEENKLVRHLSAEGRAEKPSSEKYALDSNNLGIYFSPSDQINTDIFENIGGQLLDNYIGDAQQAFEDTYSDLQVFNRKYFKKYSKDNNKMDYLNELKLYDMSLFTLLKRYLPARANADLGVVIQPHFLERSKAASRGNISVSGDTKTQNIALNAASFAKAKAPTKINCAQPEVPQLGFTLQPQTVVGKVGAVPKLVPGAPKPNLNSVIKQFTAAPQQYTPQPKKHLPNTTAIHCTLQHPWGTPQTGTSIKLITLIGAVTSHQVASPLSDMGGTATVTRKATGAIYKQTYLHKAVSQDGGHTYIKTYTPDWQQSSSLQFIKNQRPSEIRKTNIYFYKSATGTEAHALISASRGKPYEDGGSVNLYAYSKSLKDAEVSDYNLGGTSGADRLKYIGTQLNGADFNIDSLNTPDNGPVVSYTLGDPNVLISTDAGFGGTLSIQ